jgi:hypothetical protein
MKKLRLMHIIALIILMPFVLGTKCSWFAPKDEPPGPEVGCGVGTGVFKINVFKDSPSNFNCNSNSSFQMGFSPEINDDYAGFNRLYITLNKGSLKYRSNYVEFYSSDETSKYLEWGGSIPTGKYEVTAILENIQLQSNCENSIYQEFEVSMCSVYVTEYTNPEKVMEIEYFCQDSDTGCIDKYDVFLSQNTEEYINIAFNIANTTYNLTTYLTDLDPEVVVYADETIKAYISEYKQLDDEMFLCGIKAFKDTLGNLMPDLIGVTYEDDSVTLFPSCSTGSLIAVKTAIDYAALDEYQMDYNDLVTAMTIHELGLQRGAIWNEHVPTQPYPKFCIGHMYLFRWLSGEEPTHPYWTTRFINPHFCDECIAGIKNIDW